MNTVTGKQQPTFIGNALHNGYCAAERTIERRILIRSERF
jgi:hypothetical protein